MSSCPEDEGGSVEDATSVKARRSCRKRRHLPARRFGYSRREEAEERTTKPCWIAVSGTEQRSFARVDASDRSFIDSSPGIFFEQDRDDPRFLCSSSPAPAFSMFACNARGLDSTEASSCILERNTERKVRKRWVESEVILWLASVTVAFCTPFFPISSTSLEMCRI